MTFKGWIVHVGTANYSEYLLCARKPSVSTTTVRSSEGPDTLLWSTGSPWFYKYCRAGFEMLMRTQLPLGGVARMSYTLHLETVEHLTPEPSPWTALTEENYDGAIPPRLIEGTDL